MSSAPTNPLHNPETEFQGELVEIMGTSLPLDDPSVKARVRRGRPSHRPEPSNYWVVGAMFEGGCDDRYDEFIRRGYWYRDFPDDPPADVKALFSQIRIGDRIAIKRMLGAGAKEIEIRAIGVITDIDREDWSVYVTWILTDLARRVPHHGCAASIHGPYREDDEWTRTVFCT